MFYKTRHLVALSEFSHGDQHLREGDEFFATEVDAGYYLEKGRAMPAAQVATEVAPGSLASEADQIVGLLRTIADDNPSAAVVATGQPLLPASDAAVVAEITKIEDANQTFITAGGDIVSGAPVGDIPAAPAARAASRAPVQAPAAEAAHATPQAPAAAPASEAPVRRTRRTPPTTGTATDA